MTNQFDRARDKSSGIVRSTNVPAGIELPRPFSVHNNHLVNHEARQLPQPAVSVQSLTAYKEVPYQPVHSSLHDMNVTCSLHTDLKRGGRVSP